MIAFLNDWLQAVKQAFPTKPQLHLVRAEADAFDRAVARVRREIFSGQKIRNVRPPWHERIRGERRRKKVG